MGRKKKTECIKRQFTLRREVLTALQQEFKDHGHLRYPDLSSFLDGILGLTLGAERRRHTRYQQAGVRARELLYRQRDRARDNYWRVFYKSSALLQEREKVGIELEQHLPATRAEIEALRKNNPYFKIAQELGDKYDRLQELVESDQKSVSITLRVLLKHLIDGVGTDTLPPAYARAVWAEYDSMANRRAVPQEDDGGGATLKKAG